MATIHHRDTETQSDDGNVHLMRRGCLQNLLFGVLLLVAFGGSTYFWFTFFVKGRSLPTPNLIGRSVAEARRITSDLGVDLEVDAGTVVGGIR